MAFRPRRSGATLRPMSSVPRQIVMLAFADAQILDVVGPLQILAAVNDERRKPAYRLTLLAGKRGAFRTTSTLQLVADGSWENLPAEIDTLIVAGGDGTTSAVRNKSLI